MKTRGEGIIQGSVFEVIGVGVKYRYIYYRVTYDPRKPSTGRSTDLHPTGVNPRTQISFDFLPHGNTRQI
jgi:hypothetical protein